eukprot:6486043-Amphidinium_carterae.1
MQMKGVWLVLICKVTIWLMLLPTKVPVNMPVPLEPSEEWKHWSTVCQAVRNFWLTVGPTLRVRPEQWPRVRRPADAGPRT